MSYAFVQDTPATWDGYLGIAEALDAVSPEGLVMHVAGPTEEGFRMIGIWDSRETWARFRDDAWARSSRTSPRDPGCSRRIAS